MEYERHDDNFDILLTVRNRTERAWATAVCSSSRGDPGKAVDDGSGGPRAREES
jgi:hypothetical protein